MTITVWRLRDALGASSVCTVSERDGRWRLVVQRGRSVLLTERWDSDDAALQRSTELWRVLTTRGWTEPRH